MKLRDHEEEILNKQIAESENKAAAQLAEKEMKIAHMKKQIDVSRKNQITRKRNIQSAKEREDQEFGEFWKLRNNELQLAEAQEREETK